MRACGPLLTDARSGLCVRRSRSCVNSAEEALEVATKVGYPIMIKASEGGGGKGVRKATEPSQIATGSRWSKTPVTRSHPS